MVGSISVIIPTKDRLSLLQLALESLKAQTRQPDEVIVLDGGDDGSDEMVKAYSFVRYYRQQTRGLTAARNEALKLATGSYVGMLDSDDLYEPRFVEECGGVLDQQSDIGVVYTRGYAIDEAGKRLGMLLQGHQLGTDPLRDLVLDNFVVATFALARRSALLGIGGYDERLTWADDYDLILRLVLSGTRLAHVPEALGSRRRHGGSLTAAFPIENFKAIRGIIEKLQGDLLRSFGKDWWSVHYDYREGRLHFDAGEVSEAKVWFSKALRRNPWHWRARLYHLWTTTYPWANPIAIRLRELKRMTLQMMVRRGWAESRWH